ncbi:MAG TPA: hypothetical protein VJS13_05820, partial [Pyrinomonadaceae bacterium]|nr:hypothetical protein [Pyrinomonadaceae bacterium]
MAKRRVRRHSEEFKQLCVERMKQCHDIPVVEHLCGLSDLPDTGFKFFAVPVKIKNFGTFPVR